MSPRPALASLKGGRLALYAGGVGHLTLGVAYLALGRRHAGNVEQAAFEIAVLVGIPLLMLSFVRWFDGPDRRADDYWRLALWGILGTFGALLITGLYHLDLALQGNPTGDLGFSALLAADTGALLGLLVGWEEVRVRASVRRAERAETRAEISKRHEQSLAFLNGILRHHVLNGLNVIMGATYSLREETVDDPGRYFDVIDGRCRLMTEYVEDIRTVVRSLAGDDEPKVIDLVTVIEQEVRAARLSSPNATFEVTTPDAVPVIGSELTGLAIEAVIENAIKHNDTADPTVRIDVTDLADSVRVSIADDGPGIPDERKSAYFERGEHGEESLGEGLGLYLAETVLASIGGRIWIEDNQPRGTKLVVELEPPGATRDAESTAGPEPSGGRVGLPSVRRVRDRSMERIGRT